MLILFAISRGLRTVSGETAAGVVLGVTVFCMVLGSSSVTALVGPGKTLRWVALLVLAAFAVSLAVRAGPAAGRPLLVTVAFGAWLVAVEAVSAWWSVDPRLTLERAGSSGLLLAAAGGLAMAARSRAALPLRLLEGVLAAVCAAAVTGLALLAFAYGDAVEPATTDYPARFKGLGENPDTLAMLEGLATPIALWLLVRGESGRRRLLGGGALLLLLVSISASGSRGGILAAFVGCIALSLTLSVPLRHRLALSFAVCLVIAGATATTRIPKPLAHVAPGAPVVPGQALPTPLPGSHIGPPEPQYTGRLSDELFRIYAGQRSLFTSSGRLEAWYTAMQQADARPLLGYGFGTENLVFVDRVLNFDGSYVENSFLGFYLQLGAVGFASLVALLFVLASAARRAVRRAIATGPALAGVMGAGLVLMLVQSYVYSVGNVATAAFWVASFLAAGVAPASRPEGATARRLSQRGAVARV